MNTIEFSKANKEFTGKIKIGEYVAWWVSNDKQSSMTLTSDSYPTEEAATTEADIMLDDKCHADQSGRTLRDNGCMVIEQVIADSE